MHRFAKRLGLFAALLGLATSGLYWVSESVAPVYPSAKKRASLLQEKKKQVETITLRNSHNHSIDFSAMGTEGFHLWTRGGDIFEAAYILRNVYPRLDSLEYVLMPIPLYVIDNSKLPGRSEIRKEIYARYSFGADYIEGDAALFMKAKLAPLVRPDNWRGVLWPKFARPQYGVQDTVTPNGWIGPRPQRHIASDSIAASGVNRAQHHISLQERSLADHLNLCRDALKEIKRMASLSEPEATLVLYQPPYSDAYEQEVQKQKDCPNLKEQAKGIALSRSNVAFFDFSSVLPEENPHRYFRNVDHLNTRGAQLMSSALGDSLKTFPDGSE